MGVFGAQVRSIRSTLVANSPGTAWNDAAARRSRSTKLTRRRLTPFRLRHSRISDRQQEWGLREGSLHRPDSRSALSQDKLRGNDSFRKGAGAFGQAGLSHTRVKPFKNLALGRTLYNSAGKIIKSKMSHEHTSARAGTNFGDFLQVFLKRTSQALHSSRSLPAFAKHGTRTLMVRRSLSVAAPEIAALEA